MWVDVGRCGLGLGLCELGVDWEWVVSESVWVGVGGCVSLWFSCGSVLLGIGSVWVGSGSMLVGTCIFDNILLLNKMNQKKQKSQKQKYQTKFYFDIFTCYIIIYC